MARTHPNSLLPFESHRPELLAIVHRGISRDMIEHVALAAAKCVAVHSAPPLTVAPLPLVSFIFNILRNCNVSTPSLLVTLIYLDRLRIKMSRIDQASSTAMYRVFFAALIVSCKYLNDSSPKNSHWASYAQKQFPVAEINLMERQLLHLLDFDLRFSEDDACRYFAPFMGAVHTRASAVDKVAKASKIRAQQQKVEPATDVVSSVCNLAKRLSRAQLRPETPPSPHALSSCSSSSSSSDVGSLLEDNGSSSGSSSGWTSESESESEDNARVYSDTSDELYYQALPHSISNAKKPFILRPAAAVHRQRTRKASDTSSVCTVTARSPPASTSLSSLHHRRPAKSISASTTLPMSTSGGFLSRMWGAAKQSSDADISGSLKRLVLVSSRSTTTQRTSGDFNV